MRTLLELLRGLGKLGVVTQLGFDSLVTLSDAMRTTMHRDHCRPLLKSYDASSNEIKLKVDEEITRVIKVDAEAFSRVLGLRNEGIDAFGLLDRRDGDGVELAGRLGIKEQQSWCSILEQIKTEPAGSDRLKARVLIWIVGQFLCPTSSLFPSKRHFNLLTHDGLDGRYNWAKLGADYMVRGMQVYKRSIDAGKMKYFLGCLAVLEVRG